MDLRGSQLRRLCHKASGLREKVGGWIVQETVADVSK